jgi:hypothetical protein
MEGWPEERREEKRVIENGYEGAATFALLLLVGP